MTYIIAEIGNNHEGNPEAAMRLVDAAIVTGVDAVKMQLFEADTLVDKSMPSMVGTHKTQWERMKALEIPREIYVEAAKRCHEAGRHFIVSAFSPELIEWATPIVDKIKIASGDMMYKPLLDAAFGSDKDVIVSTGMHDLDQIDWLMENYDPWALLHCVSLYPTPDDQANLQLIGRLADWWPDQVIGYSDHTIGITACLAAIALGAEVIEKHFKIDHCNKAGDFAHSATQSEMTKFVQEARRVDMLCSYPCDFSDEMAMKTYLVRGENGLRGTYLCG